MSFDLRTERWIPFIRRSGVVEWANPTALGVSDDPVVGIASSRADFDGALHEFLIGLLTAALAPANDDEWIARFRDPPTAGEIASSLDGLPDAFKLDGDGPRVFQDLAAADFDNADVVSIDRMLIESPGEQGVKYNTDLFIKRNRTAQLGRPAAAMALITLQTYAPSGGSGHRTSLRGGGPLTTLIDPRVDDGGRSVAQQRPLWDMLWANVETLDQLASRSPTGVSTGSEHVFPWLAPTRTSGRDVGGRETTAADAHPLQAYFGMPRRIRLEFGPAGMCDLTGRRDEVTVLGFRMLNYGVNYSNWRHPLSPYYRVKSNAEWLPMHGQPGGIGWRDWASLALDGVGADREPALSVSSFYRRGVLLGVARPRIHAFGYDMDNMKASGWVDATLPAFAIDDPAIRGRLHDEARAMVDAAGIAGLALGGAVRAVLFPHEDSLPGDAGAMKDALWGATEAEFYKAMSAMADLAPDGFSAQAEGVQLKRQFVAQLEGAALDVFDRLCPAEGAGAETVRRRVLARYNLSASLRGFSKLGKKLFAALGLPVGDGERARSRGGNRGSRSTKPKPEDATRS